MIRAMPLAATVATRNGPVGLVHASPTARAWDAMLGMLRAGDPDTVWHALENTAIARADRLRAAQDGMPDDGQIDGVRAVITVHTPLFRVACTGNTPAAQHAPSCKRSSRLEDIEADPSWRGVTGAAKTTARQRLGYFDKHRQDIERATPK